MNPAEKVRAQVQRSLRHRVMTSCTLCRVAERELAAGHVDCARETLETIRRMVGGIAVLIGEPRPVAASTIQEAAEMFAELEMRTQTIEAALPEVR